VQAGGSGTNVYLTIENIGEGIEIQHVYFRNYIQKAKNTEQNPDQFIAYFKDAPKRDVIMDGEVIKEAQNTPPQGLFPFKLKDNEAVISYLQKDEMKYFKISEIEEKPIIAYPESNKGGIEEN
ncbi:MAG: hypothetical protein HKN48_10875, partial [Flavobacteriaceae bacterium]|nr:hypothetical protein [Flavobacteriaceae bacterium]